LAQPDAAAVLLDAHDLPKHRALLRLVEDGQPWIEHRVLGQVRSGQRLLPLHALLLGNPDPACPAVGLFGGVHGLERIGSDVVMSFIDSLVQRLRWDRTLQDLLQGLRLVVMPMVNPGGLLTGSRANPAGVDLMRNAPVEAGAGVPWLVGGHRLSAHLPWYRGPLKAPMQPESEALCRLVETELLPRPFTITVDCHSGFGLNDRVWFPFAHTARPIEHLPELHALAEVFDRSLPQHPYVMEPQSRQYLTHGDLWDHLYLASRQRPDHIFLPLTLEMGSWLWVKKNPRQMFSRDGIFNPLIQHRQQRVLRRQHTLLDFILRAALSHAQWLPKGAATRARHHEQALARWYRIPRSARP